MADQPKRPGRITKERLGGHARHLGAYRKLLRHAARIGWQDAKLKYLGRETKRGIPREDVLVALDVIERLYISAAISGVDPVLSQRRFDIDTFVSLPVAILLGALVVGASAIHDIGPFAAIALACFAVMVVRKLANSIAPVLAG